MTSQFTRRAMLATTAAGLAMPHVARAAGPITLRVSSSAPPDRFGAHYLWFQPFEAELAKHAGDRIKLEYFPNSQLGKEADVVRAEATYSITITSSSAKA